MGVPAVGVAADLPLAYVSKRRSADPAFFGRVVIENRFGHEAEPHHPCASRIDAVAGPIGPGNSTPYVSSAGTDLIAVLR
jgi:hypothetical protein